MQKHIQELIDTGLTYIPGAYSAEDCKKYVEKAKALLPQYVAEGLVDPHADSYNLNNYFRHDADFMPLVLHPTADEVLKHFLNPDYTLINSNFINRFRKHDMSTDNKEVKHAGHWHSDSRYLGGKRVSTGFTIIGIVMLEDFGRDNGATHYIPGSQNNTGFPERYGTYEHEYIEGKAGTLVLFDSALWHRGGPASAERTRWSVYTIYGPSFMKPYYWYPKMFNAEQAAGFSPTLRRLFHYDSIPPTDEVAEKKAAIQ